MKKAIYALLLVGFIAGGALAMQAVSPWPGPGYRWYPEWGVDHSQDPNDPLGGVNGNGNGVIDEDWEDRAPNPRA